MNIKAVMPNINKQLRKDLPFIGPDEHAHEGLSVPEIVMKYGSLRSKARSLPRLFGYMTGCIKELKKSYAALYEQPVPFKTNISDHDLKALLDYIKTFNIDDIGFTAVQPSMIFSDKAILFDQAIVLIMKMDHDAIDSAPSKIAEKEIFRTYYELNVSVNKIKTYLNDKGYRAQAGPALGGEVNYPVLANQAGLGAIGKHGLLITPEHGPCIRIAVVYTDIKNLPITTENKYNWMEDFCDKCNQCVRTCPSGAIYQSSIIFEDGSKSCIDYKKCAVPFSKDHGCTVCIKSCTYFNRTFKK